MRQAIVTKYLGPTNFRGSRIAGGMPTETGNCYVNTDAVFDTDAFEIGS